MSRALSFILSLSLIPAAFAAESLPDYKAGDVVTQDVVTTVALSVIDPAATDALQVKEARRVRFVVRYLPGEKEAVEKDLRETVARVKAEFLAQLKQALKGRAPEAGDVDKPVYRKTLRGVAANAPKNFPMNRLAPLWTAGESDEEFVSSLLKDLSTVMSRPVIAARMDEPLPGRELVRLVNVSTLDRAPTLQQAERGGSVTNAGRMIPMWHARQYVITNFPGDLPGPGRFAASFLRTNANPDIETTTALRALRTDQLAVRVEYQPGDTLLRKGQLVDPLSLAALAALREKSLVGTLQSKLEVAEAKAEATRSVTSKLDLQGKWILAGFGALGAGIVLVLWRLRARRLASLLPVALEGASTRELPANEAQWRDRALNAEARAQRAQEAVREGVMGMMKDKVVHGLFDQRSDLLSNQQRAEAEMHALEQRLEQIHAPLQERISAYEKRIAELERELAVKGEENIELIKAKISLAKHQLEVERGRSGRFGTN